MIFFRKWGKKPLGLNFGPFEENLRKTKRQNSWHCLSKEIVFSKQGEDEIYCFERTGERP